MKEGGFEECAVVKLEMQGTDEVIVPGSVDHHVVNISHVVHDRLKPYVLGDIELKVKDAADTTPNTKKTAKQPNVSFLCRCLQFLIPLVAVISGSLVAPLAAIQPPAKLPGSKASKTSLLLSWRFGPLCFLLLAASPFYALYLYCTRSDEPEKVAEASSENKETADNEEEEKPSTLKLVSALILANVSQQIGSAGFCAVSFYTVMSHAYLITNMSGILTLIFGMLCCGVRTHRLEKIGIVVTLIGTTLMIFDPSAVKYGQQVNVLANILALPVNIPFAFFFVINGYLNKHFDIVFLVTQSAVCNFIVYSLVAVYVEGANFDMSDKGVFGFLRPDNWLISLFGNGIFSALLGMYGFVWALKYFSPVFVMNVNFVKPVLGQVFGVALGTDDWPGWMTWVGIVIVSSAVKIIYEGEQRRDELVIDPEESENNDPKHTQKIDIELKP